MSGANLTFRSFLETLGAALAGAVLFHILHLPAPSLSGAMVGVTLLLAAGRRVHMPKPVADGAMLASGVAMGTAVTPEMLGGFQKYPLSLAVFVLSVGTTIVLTQTYLRRVCGWHRMTAFFAATPGALSTVLAVAAETRADMLKVTTVQSFRLFMLVAVLPALVTATGGASALPPRPDTSLLGMAVLCACGLALAFGLTRIGLAAPWIFGGLMASAILHGAGLVTGDAPKWFMEAAFGLVGLFIGTRFSTLTRAAFVQALGISIGALVIGMAVAFAAAALLHAVSGLPFGQVLVAFAPGGLEAMLVLGASLGLDPIYVGLHHLVRFFGIAFLLPAAMPLLMRQAEGDVPVRDKS